MIKVGITGQSGFIGTHLFNTLGLHSDIFEIVPFEKSFFNNQYDLDNFVTYCDVIVHFAAVNRNADLDLLYQTNINLTQLLISALERTNSKPHVIISSSSQEIRDNLYGKSKKESRELLYKWAKQNNALFTGLIIPNVFGPFGLPFYNSVIATFSHQISNGENPEIHVDGNLELIYVAELISEIIFIIKNKVSEPYYKVNYTHQAKVSEILNLLNCFKKNYQDLGEIPKLNNVFELNLFNSFRCYINIKEHFPVMYKPHSDARGTFVEIIRLGQGGQVSFSTTRPNITRGNHFHTRKIERFSVIKGKALIQLRKIGTNDTLDYYLSGDEPAYVDMPIWHTHNIKNIGDEDLYTMFWINEFYDANDPDTYFEIV